MDVPLDQRAIQALFELPDREGEFPPQAKNYLLDLGRRRPAVVLAFAPKSAGTFLRSAVIAASGGELVRIVHAQGGRDAQPYLPTLIAYYLGGVTSGPLVTHVHLQALGANLRFFEAFNIRPIIMIRSVPDMLASYWDMLDMEIGALSQGLNCGIPQAWPTFTADQKADFLIDMLGPWYASYFGTWLEYAQKADERVCLLEFSDFVSDPTTIVWKICKHSGLQISRAKCQRAVDGTWKERYQLRYNQGEEGRGRRYFKPRHFEHLARMLSFYPAALARQEELLPL